MIRFYNGRVLSLDGDLEVRPGEVWTDGDRIAHVGPAPAQLPQFERKIDLRGDLVMPGFKNAHTHSAMTFLRSYADDLPLQAWLFDKVFPLEARLTPEAVYAFTRVAILEYLSSGVTASFDMYYHRDAYCQANIECGFRTVLCGALTAGDDPAIAERDYENYNRLHPLIRYQLGAHAEYTADETLLRGLAELVRKYQAPFWAHNSETESEVAECVQRHGMTPTAWFDSLGLFDYGGGGFHCVWMSEEDLDIFVRRGLWAVTNPASNAKLASGIAPLDRFAAKGVQLAMGTDGPASNNALDMFREMYLACVLQKLKHRDAAACPAEDILRAATLGGAGAMGLTDCDVLAPGKQADLIVIDLSRPNMQPENNIVKNLVYSGSKENVRLTMVAGRILYENGAFDVGDEPAHIYEQAARLTRQIQEG